MISGKTTSQVDWAVKSSGRAVAYCALSIKAGTRDEGDFPLGIAHFTEHTIFRGTSRRSATSINNCLDRLGGELNAYTTKEEIVIHATVLKEDLRKALSLILDLATDATFPEDEIDTERGVVIDEIKSYKDSPADDVYDRFEEMFFPDHPLSRPILGTAQSVRRITSSDLRAFYASSFRPSSMALTIVAPLEEERLARVAQSVLGKYFPGDGEPGGESPSRALRVPAAVRFDKSIDKRNHEVNAVFGALAPSLYDGDDRYACILLSNLLGGPSSNSILNEVLRERHGWVYGVETAYTQYSDAGLFAVSLGCDKANLPKCETAMRTELDKLMQTPLSGRRLQAAKKQLLGQLAVSSESGESQCLSMGKNLLSFGRITPDGEIVSRIEAITPEKLMELSRRLFVPESMSRLVFI